MAQQQQKQMQQKPQQPLSAGKQANVRCLASLEEGMTKMLAEYRAKMDQLRAEKEALLADRCWEEGLLVGPTPSPQLNSPQVPVIQARTFPPAGTALQPLALPPAQRRHLTAEQEEDPATPQQQHEARRSDATRSKWLPSGAATPAGGVSRCSSRSREHPVRITWVTSPEALERSTVPRLYPPLLEKRLRKAVGLYR